MGKVMSNQSLDLMSMFGPQGHHRGEPIFWLQRTNTSRDSAFQLHLSGESVIVDKYYSITSLNNNASSNKVGKNPY